MWRPSERNARRTRQQAELSNDTRPNELLTTLLHQHARSGNVKTMSP